MKKFVLGLVLCLSLVAVGFSYSFSIKATGGASFLMGGDYNAGIQGMKDYYAEFYSRDLVDNLKKLSFGFNFGAEFIFNFTPNVGVGLGAGYMMASTKDSTIEGTSPGFLAWPSEDYRNLSVSVIPITLNLHYTMPMGGMNFHFFAGPGLYITSADLEYGFAGILSYYDGTLEASKTAFGFQGGLGIEIPVGTNMAFVFDIYGRYASLSEVTGDYSESGRVLIWPYSDSGTGTIYYYEYEDYGFVDVYEDPPSSSSYRNVRKASLSLSGVGAVVGFKINL